MKRTEKGITLIALIITIIVMLILVGVTVTSALNGGLFNTAKYAVGQTKDSVDAERELSSGNIVNYYLNEQGGENPDPTSSISVRYDNNGTLGIDDDDKYFVDGIPQGYTAQYRICTAKDHLGNVGETEWSNGWQNYDSAGLTFYSSAPYCVSGPSHETGLYVSGDVYMYVKLLDKASNEYEIEESFSLTNFCFVKDTLVLTANGLKEIQKLKSGDIVISYNEQTKQTEEKPIIVTHHNKVNYDTVIISIGKNIIECTKGHNMYTVNRGWIEAQYLTNEDILLDSNNNNIKITDIKIKTNDYIDVYNLTIKDNHNYFVGEDSVLTHNIPSGWRNYCNGFEAAIT